MPADFPVVGFGVTNAFGDLTFEQPVVIASPPAETNRIFIASKTGRIFVVTNLAAPTRTEFLDASAGLVTLAEAGLIGMAFHPGYASNGYFYVYRTILTNLPGIHPGIYDEIARYTADPANPDRALPGSKVTLLMQYDHSSMHNGGDLQFGPDGYLYVAMGDDGPAPGEGEQPLQAIDRHFFGGILRIDVDQRPGSLPPNPYPGVVTNYAIPPDNPFIGRTSYNGKPVNPGSVRTEFYAVGLRNPWRIAFDGNDLYCADVGSALLEEINLIQAGRNYGWPYAEGTFIRLTPPPQFNHTPPVYQHSRGNRLAQGPCIIGGRVYRGSRFPQLHGAYVFGDFVNGRIWAVRRQGGTVSAVENLAGVPDVCTFGVDPANGDLLIASLGGGIFRLIYVDPASVSAPVALSETGAFADVQTLQPNPGIVPYNVAVPFWSDNAIKRRWFSLPDINSTITFSPTSHWAFPAGAVWIKHFDLELTNGVASSRRRIETRFIVKQPGGVYGVTYRWNASGTDALLVPEGGMEETFTVRGNGQTRQQTWIYPSRHDCRRCHNEAAGYVLGFNTPQLNCPSVAGGSVSNQIEALAAEGYLAGPVTAPESWPKLSHPTNSLRPIQDRVRSYLHANCSFCHFPGGPVTSWDARITTPLADANLVDGLVGGPIWQAYRILKPRDPAHSLIPERMNSQSFRMPPLGSALVDSNAIALLTEYVLGIRGPPWESSDIGETKREGSSSILEGMHRVNGAGTNIAGAADAFHFLHRPLTGNVQLVARLASSKASPAHAGLMLRASTDPKASFAMLSTGPSDATLYRRHRREDGVNAGIVGLPLAPAYRWWRLVREGDVVRAYASIGGTEWTALGEDVVSLGEQFIGGFAVSSSDAHEVAGAAFDNFSTVTVRLDIPEEQRAVSLADDMELRAEVAADGTTVERVEFYNGAEKIGEARNRPFAISWKDAVEGTHQIRAKVIADSGSVFSEPITVERFMPASRLAFRRVDWLTRGAWKGAYGGIGVVIAGDVTNLPPHITFAAHGASHKRWALKSPSKPALQRAEGKGRAAAAWESRTNFTVDLGFLDGGLYQLSLYFVDWEGIGRTQFVEIMDAATGSMLASQTISSFKRGVYFSYAVRGKIQIRVTRKAGPDAVLSGVFIDRLQSIEPPTVKVTQPANNQTIVIPSATIISANAGSAVGIEQVEFYIDGTPIGAAMNEPYEVAYHFAKAGSYTLTARAMDRLGEWKASNPVTVHARLPAASAELLWTDRLSQGTWIGVYGGEGYAIPGHATNYPPYVDVDLGGALEYVYFPEGGLRELQKVDGSGRIFPVWIVQKPVRMTFTDGGNHALALYFVDPEGIRHQRIRFWDGDTGNLVFTGDLPSFRDGVYFVWNVRGNLRLELTAVFGPNTYLGGMFFAPLLEESPITARLTPVGFANGSMTFTVRRGKLIPNVSWIVEVSEDLIQWAPSGGVVIEPIDLGFAEELKFHVPAAASSQQGFYRLRRVEE